MLKYPVIIHMPYNSTYIPDNEREMLLLSDSEIKNELMVMTDWYLNEVFDNEEIEIYRSFVSRLVFDPERFRNDNDNESVFSGMGPIYSKGYEGKEIRKVDLKLREFMLFTYYDPYHRAFSDRIKTYIEKYNKCLIINTQTFMNSPLSHESDKSLPRPAFCIGTDDYHTAHKLPQFAYDFFYWGENEPVAFNKPINGSFVPMQYYHSDKRVQSIKLAINRSLYMNEETGSKLKSFYDFKDLMQRFINELSSFFSDFGLI